jgi:hypothetical protein
MWRRRLNWLICHLPYFYLLRVPILTGTALILLPLIALRTAARPLLGNLFDVDEAGICEITLVSFVSSWTVMVTGWIIVLYASRRFKVPRVRVCFPPRPIHVTVYSLLVLPTAVGMIAWSVSQSQKTIGTLAIYAVGGAALSVYLLLRMLPLVNTLSGVADWITPLARLGAGYTASPKNAAKDLVLEWRSVPVNKFGKPTYRDPARLPGWKTGRVLLPGHALALASAVGFFIVYLIIGIGKWVRIGTAPLVPTLGFVLLLGTVLCFVLSGMTFFFDRYRVPILLPLLLLCMATSQFSCSDHFFSVIARDEGGEASLSPAEALGAGGRSKVIVVASNGGGIQAAAWTAQVLTGLEQQCRTEARNGCEDFAGSVRFISSVSGGSVGSMYFVNSYDEKTHTPPADLSSVRERAQASSLDDIAWGLCYPDLWRIILPWFWKGIDRGMALENALTREDSLARPLSAWRKGVREGWRPATVFNATVVDTGERLYLSTTDSPSRAGGSDLYGKNFATGKDIKIVTAARLSASFPFVTPAARADLPGPRMHVADGGYYDNYGVATLVEWLDEALSGPNNPIRSVMVIEILGSPKDTPARLKSHGWFYQAFAPIEAMLNVRTAAQFAHNQEESDLLTRLWKTNGGQPVTIQHAIFQFCDPDPPLSWHLSPKQKGAIADAWSKEIKNNKNWQRVVRFLAGDTTLPETPANACPGL